MPAESKWLRTESATFHKTLKHQWTYLYLGSQFRSFSLPFSSLFPTSGHRGPGPHPKVIKRHPNGPQGCPNGAQGCHNGAPRSPQIHKKPPKYVPRVTKWTPGFHNGAPRSHQVLKRHHKALQNATKTPKYGPRCQKNDIPTNRHISSKIHGIFFKGRRQCFAHQYDYM